MDDFLLKLEADQERLRDHLRGQALRFRKIGEAINEARRNNNVIFVFGEESLEYVALIVAQEFLRSWPVVPVSLNHPKLNKLPKDRPESDEHFVPSGLTRPMKRLAESFRAGDVLLLWSLEGDSPELRTLLKIAKSLKLVVLVVGGIGGRDSLKGLYSVYAPLPTRGIKTLCEASFICARLIARSARTEEAQREDGEEADEPEDDSDNPWTKIKKVQVADASDETSRRKTRRKSGTRRRSRATRSSRKPEDDDSDEGKSKKSARGQSGRRKKATASAAQSESDEVLLDSDDEGERSSRKRKRKSSKRRSTASTDEVKNDGKKEATRKLERKKTKTSRLKSNKSSSSSKKGSGERRAKGSRRSKTASADDSGESKRSEGKAGKARRSSRSVKRPKDLKDDKRSSTKRRKSASGRISKSASADDTQESKPLDSNVQGALEAIDQDIEGMDERASRKSSQRKSKQDQNSGSKKSGRQSGRQSGQKSGRQKSRGASSKNKAVTETTSSPEGELVSPGWLEDNESVTAPIGIGSSFKSSGILGTIGLGSEDFMPRYIRDALNPIEDEQAAGYNPLDDSGEGQGPRRFVSNRFEVQECTLRFAVGAYPDDSVPSHPLLTINPQELSFVLDNADVAAATLNRGDELWLRIEVPAFLEPILVRAVVSGFESRVDSQDSGVDIDTGLCTRLKFLELSAERARKIRIVAESLTPNAKP